MGLTYPLLAHLKPTYEGLKGKLGDAVNVQKGNLKPTYEGLKEHRLIGYRGLPASFKAYL